MNLRLVAVVVLCAWTGMTLVLSTIPWFSRPSLRERIRPHLPFAASAAPPERGVLSVASFGDVVGPLAHTLGETIARLLGHREELAVRLQRIASPHDVTSVRMRQLGLAAAALVGAGLLAEIADLPPAAALLVVLGAPVLAWLLVEQDLATRSARWQQRVFLELPVVAEQLGMLLSAGYSLGGALQRLARRSNGAIAADLALVCARIHQGLTEIDALREWAERADVTEVTRLVDVLALNREAGDLGHLIAEEARAARQEVQRRTLELMERRGQQVWIPVTVATLVPGVLFLTVPFLEAMRLFSEQ